MSPTFRTLSFNPETGVPISVKLFHAMNFEIPFWLKAGGFALMLFSVSYGVWLIGSGARGATRLGDEYNAAAMRALDAMDNHGDIDTALANFANAEAKMNRQLPAELGKMVEGAARLEMQAYSIQLRLDASAAAAAAK